MKFETGKWYTDGKVFAKITKYNEKDGLEYKVITYTGKTNLNLQTSIAQPVDDKIVNDLEKILKKVKAQIL